MDIEIKNFVCIECGKTFDKNQKMLLHHRMTHILWKNPEFIKLRKESVKKQWEDDSFKEKMLPVLKNNSKENWKRDDYRKERSKISRNIMLNNWKSDDFKKIMYRKIVDRKTASVENKKAQTDSKKIIKNNERRSESTSKRLKELWKNPLYREKMSKLSQETAERIRNNPEIKKQRSVNAKKQWNNLEFRKYMLSIASKNGKIAWQKPGFIEAQKEKCKKQWNDPEFRISRKKKMDEHWNDPVWKEKTVRSYAESRTIPNKCEQSLQQILNELFPNEWKFTGGGENSVVLGGFVPDFMNCNGKKLLIEFDGSYWHGLQKVKEKDLRKLAKYKELGFDTLVIKENEFKNDKESIKNQIVEFVKNYEKEHSSLLV